MLQRLYVKNYAIIDESEVEFKDKLNILTGETGAGKSILIGSVNAALGAKTSKEVIRSNADSALMEITFSNLPDNVLKELAEFDIFPEGGEITLSRKITSSGKSVCRINGETVTLADLKECSERLLDIHGQNEHHSLIKPANQLKIVDDYAGKSVDDLKASLATEFSAWKKLRDELKEAADFAENSDNDVSYLEFAVNEIKAANLKAGEDEELEEEYRTLSNARAITEGLGQAYNLVGSDRGESVVNMLSEAMRALSKASSYDRKILEMNDSLNTASDILADFLKTADDYMESFENSEERFSEVSERLDLINTLKKKYARLDNSIEGVIKYLADQEEKLEKLSDYDAYMTRLRAEEDKQRKICLDICDRLSEKRLEAAGRLENEISKALKDLNFASCAFKCEFTKNDRFTANGYDIIEFNISLNPGEPLRPLTKIASGGELSRIMLAIKSVLADKDEIPTLIFDEIDTGISGRTAQMVAEKLAEIAKTHQVICITHLAQLAAMADSHYLIEKTSGTDFVKTEIKELSEDNRISEVARILGGAEITDKVRESAVEMIQLANKIKRVN